MPEGDPNTTNICVTNLHEGVNEEVLMREFGRWGALASVKVRQEVASGIGISAFVLRKGR